MSPPQPPRPAGPPVAIGEALAKLTDMLDAVGGTVDQERRRAAACLSELIRSTDEDLPRFAQRHLPGRDVDAVALTDAREVAVEIARLVTAVGEDPAAAATLRELRVSLSRGFEPLVSRATSDALESRPSAPLPFPAAPPDMAVAQAASALPTFMQSPLVAASYASIGQWPPVVEQAAPITQRAPAGPPAALDPGTTQRLAPLPFGTLAAPALPFAAPAASASGAADQAARPEAPTTALPFAPAPPRRG